MCYIYLLVESYALFYLLCCYYISTEVLWFFFYRRRLVGQRLKLSNLINILNFKSNQLYACVHVVKRINQLKISSGFEENKYGGKGKKIMFLSFITSRHCSIIVFSITVSVQCSNTVIWIMDNKWNEQHSF